MNEELTYEAAYNELQQIAGEIENEAVSVDLLAEKVKRAAILIEFCQQKLRATETEVNNIIRQMEGRPGDAGGTIPPLSFYGVSVTAVAAISTDRGGSGDPGRGPRITAARTRGRKTACGFATIWLTSRIARAAARLEVETSMTR